MLSSPPNHLVTTINEILLNPSGGYFMIAKLVYRTKQRKRLLEPVSNLPSSNVNTFGISSAAAATAPRTL